LPSLDKAGGAPFWDKLLERLVRTQTQSSLFSLFLSDEEKSFITLKSEVNLIKPSSSLMKRPNKLE
jgi:hypothetical protein